MKSVVRASARLSILAFLLFSISPTASSAEPALRPMNVRVESAVSVGVWKVYGIRVASAGSPVLAVLPSATHVALLTVNGTTVETSGRDFDLGLQPFGHGSSALRLSGLLPSDDIAIRMRGGDGPPEIVSNLANVSAAFGSGLGSGVVYGILVTLVLFQVLAAFSMKEPTLLWYVLWIGSVIGIQLARDDLLHLERGATVQAITLLNIAAQCGYVGFVVAYLRLREQAPRLFLLFLITTISTTAFPLIVGLVTRQRPPLNDVFIANAISIVLAMVIAFRRQKAGFTPAPFLAYGLIGNLLFFTGKPIRDLLGIESPFLDHWAIELVSVFDFLVFSLGTAYGLRFAQRKHQRTKAALYEASLAAAHDPLTGLLNRRGLEEWMDASETIAGTILFIDLDGFKAVNDEGTHTAGDDVLSVVSRIIRHSVREEDAVARFGGDEFVVVLLDCYDDALIKDVIARVSAAVSALTPLGVHSATRIGVSIGTAPFIEHARYREALMNADADTYRIKAEHHATRREMRGQHNAPPAQASSSVPSS